MNKSIHAAKHYLVVGASSGIGAAIAKRLASQGATVCLIARRSEKLLEVQKGLPGSGHSSHVFDVTEYGGIRPLLESIVGHSGALDGMAYCAAVSDTCRLRDLTPQQMENSMRANFYPFLEFVRQLVNLKQRSAPIHIVAISSLASVCNDKYFTLYSAPKAAMDAAVRCLSTELVKKNVTINTIRPGWVDVERVQAMTEHLGNVDEYMRKTGYQPQGLIPVNEIAEFASFLLSPQSAHITGTNLPYNGGAR